MNPTAKELGPKKEFPGSAGDSKKLPAQESIKPTREFSGGEGSIPKSPNS